MCVIMHNMIVKNKGEYVTGGLKFENMGNPIQLSNENPVTFEEFVHMH